MQRLKRIVEGTDTPAGRAFDLAIQVLIVMSLIAFSIETIPDIDPRLRAGLEIFEALSILVFAAEYVLRLIVAERRVRFVLSPAGIIDMLAIVPFYLRVGIDLRAVRVFRLFRIFRVFKLLRYNRAMRRYASAFASIREELVLYFMACALLMFMASIGIYYFESAVQPEQFGSIFDCMWWALVTLTTVGYGDSFPITVGGKLFTSLIVVLGIGTVAVPSGLIASALERTRRLEDEASSDAAREPGDRQGRESPR